MTLGLTIAFVVGTLVFIGDYSRRKLLANRFREYSAGELVRKDGCTTKEVLASVKLNDLACEAWMTKHIPAVFKRPKGVCVRAVVKDSDGNPQICFVANTGKVVLVSECNNPKHYWEGQEKFVCQVH